jgi:hypothetical protein
MPKDYILIELERLVDRISPQQLAERARSTVPREDLVPSPAEILRAERDERSGQP